MRKFVVFILLGSLFIAMTACGEVQSVSTGQEIFQIEENDIFYSFTDSLGETVTLKSRPTRVAILLSSYVEIWQLAGGLTSITVGDAVERGFVASETSLVDDGAGLKIDVEALVAYQPDFVIGSSDLSAQVEACERLREMEIPCATFREETFEDYLSMLKIFTDITGNSEAYETYGEQVKQRVEAALQEANRRSEERSVPLSVLFIRAGSGDSATRAKTAEDHFVGVMLKEIGTYNIAEQAGALSEHLSLEYILTDQPDCILITTQGDEDAAVEYMQSVLQQSGWKDLRAVADGQCYYLPKELFQFKPNAKWDEAYRYLIDLIYPEETDA